ncbi:MAG: FAD binding domain-containing protein [Aeromicrobium sp.]
MKPPAFAYVPATTVEEAIVALASSQGDAKILAGGQSLVPLLNFRLAAPSTLVDINRIPNLAGIKVADGRLHIGATTRARVLELDPLVRETVPILAAAARWVGHVQIRNRGTVGGSIAHADPAAELPAMCRLLDATIELAGRSGTRTVEAGDLFLGFLTTTIDEDEVLTGISIPVLDSRERWGFEEFAHRRGDFALAGSGVVVRRSTEGTIDQARIVVFGTADRPMRAERAETSLAGAHPSADLVAHAAMLAAEEAMDDDPRPDAGYRRRLAQTMVSRALTKALLSDGAEAAA